MENAQKNGIARQVNGKAVPRGWFEDQAKRVGEKVADKTVDAIFGLFGKK